MAAQNKAARDAAGLLIADIPAVEQGPSALERNEAALADEAAIAQRAREMFKPAAVRRAESRDAGPPSQRGAASEPDAGPAKGMFEELDDDAFAKLVEKVGQEETRRAAAEWDTDWTDDDSDGGYTYEDDAA